MTVATPVVEMCRVTKRFGPVTALDVVDLVVGAGTVHGVVGPNGAGKTTLFSVLFGLTAADAGSVRMFGREREDVGAGWLDGVGGFIETPRFYPYLSGRRNLVALGALDGRDSLDLIDDLLHLVGLSDASDQKVRGYSLGMRQRLGLAASLLRRPRLLILDEPTNGMDPAGMKDLRSALKRLAATGLSVLLASHDMAQVEEICDAVTVMHKGKVAFAGSIDRMRDGAPDPAWRLRTSDDSTAITVGRRSDELKIEERPGGLLVQAPQSVMDTFVVDLGWAGVAVREMSLDMTPLESLFFALTESETAAR